LLDIDRRIQACRSFRLLPQAHSLAAANKRISNILKKTEQPIPDKVEASRLTEAAERQLADALTEIRQAVVPMLDAGDYTPALTRLAGLRDSVDAFFDQVMVMVDEEALRTNRLALLKSLRDLFLRVADLSRLQS
jgi:glycyl-tRNA synthetase beta chain